MLNVFCPHQCYFLFVFFVLVVVVVGFFLHPLVKKVNCNQLANHFIPMTERQDAPWGISLLKQAQTWGKLGEKRAPGRLEKAWRMLSLGEKTGKSQAFPDLIKAYLQVPERSCNK